MGGTYCVKFELSEMAVQILKPSGNLKNPYEYVIIPETTPTVGGMDGRFRRAVMKYRHCCSVNDFETNSALKEETFQKPIIT